MKNIMRDSAWLPTTRGEADTVFASFSARIRHRGGARMLSAAMGGVASAALVREDGEISVADWQSLVVANGHDVRSLRVNNAGKAIFMGSVESVYANGPVTVFGEVGKWALTGAYPARQVLGKKSRGPHTVSSKLALISSGPLEVEGLKNVTDEAKGQVLLSGAQNDFEAWRTHIPQPRWFASQALGFAPNGSTAQEFERVLSSAHVYLGQAE